MLVPHVMIEWVEFSFFGAKMCVCAAAAMDFIPEPATWAMLLIGFAGIGFAAYRRRKHP
jgi:PEP-CTERM motif-containing protein